MNDYYDYGQYINMLNKMKNYAAKCNKSVELQRAPLGFPYQYAISYDPVKDKLLVVNTGYLDCCGQVLFNNFEDAVQFMNDNESELKKFMSFFLEGWDFK